MKVLTYLSQGSVSKIKIKIGNYGKEQSFARYVVSQGGLVLFTSEFEKYLRDKTGKRFTFKSLVARWLKTESQRKEFSQFLLVFFGTDTTKSVA
jgi:hypothetical protein